MKITEQTESRLVVRNSSMSTVVVGAVVLLAGILVLLYSRHTVGIMVVGLGFAIAGLASLLLARDLTVTADRLRATVTIRARSPLRSMDKTVAIAAVDRVTTDQLYAADGPSDIRIVNTQWSKIIVVFKDGSYVVLDREVGKTRRLPGGAAFTQGADRTVETALAQFLGVPLVVNPDNISEALGEPRRKRRPAP